MSELRVLVQAFADTSRVLKCDDSLRFLSSNLAWQNASLSAITPPIILFVPLFLVLTLTIGRAIAGKEPAVLPVLIAARVAKGILKEKVLLSLIMVAVAVDALGSHLLGPVRYNTTHFDVITHVMAGFLVKEYIERLDNYHLPFIYRIKSISPRRAQRFITPTTLAFGLMVMFELLEGVQATMPGSLGEGVEVIWGWEDQFKDIVISNPIGILISARKARLRQAGRRIIGRA